MAPASVHLRGAVLGRLARWSPVGLEVISAGLVERWLGGLEVSRSSRRTYLKQLRGFYRWAVQRELVATDPTAGLPLPPEPRRVPRPLAWPDVEAAAALSPRPVSAWVTLAAYAGLRCAEIAGLEGGDLADGVLIVVEGKGGRQRMIPAHPRVVDVLADYPATGRLWLADARQVSHDGNRWLRRLGVPGTMHQLRHTFATGIYEGSGGDLFATQQLLGHASPATTQIYVEVARSRLAAAVAGLPE